MSLNIFRHKADIEFPVHRVGVLDQGVLVESETNVRKTVLNRKQMIRFVLVFLVVISFPISGV